MNSIYSDKKILILGAGEMQVPIIKKAKELGLFTIVADFSSTAPGFEFADKALNISTLDVEQCTKDAEKCHIDGILTTSDQPVVTVSRVARYLGLPSMGCQLAEICTNKSKQRLIFSQLNIPSPKFTEVASLDALKEINNFPVIIKPIDSSGSRGVKKVNSLSELEKQYPITLSESKQNVILVEQYIKGCEYSVETVSYDDKHHIIAITEKKLINNNEGYFVEGCHIIPAQLGYKEEKLINDTILRLLNLLNVNNTPCHIELKIFESKVYIIEVACRLGGDYITSNLVPNATGIDMLKSLIDISLGNKCEINTKNMKSSLVQFITKDNYHKCKEFIKKGSVSIDEFIIKDYSDSQVTSSHDRLGYIILKSNTYKELNEIVKYIK